MKKVKSFVNKNYKVLIGFIVGGLVFGSIVYAETIFKSSDVEYDNKTSGLSSTNLQGAIDELNTKATTKIAEAKAECPSGNSCRKIEYSNSNIVAAYQYNSSNCITGEESACIKIPIRSADSVAIGTIIKYKVNASTIKYFHVLHDDGDAITMQQRENTTDNVEWYSSKDNTKGPTTALASLESATSSWSNVNTQTYTMGTTNFNGTDAYTGCSDALNCTTNTYTLGSRTGKARMITLQEATALGCTTDISSCPIWMNNYLYYSTSYGGTENDNTDSNGNTRYGYWTMSARSSKAYGAWVMNYIFNVNGNSSTTSHSNGTRAVVVINK